MPRPEAGGAITGSYSCPGRRSLGPGGTPFLAPQAVRGKPNQPANVVATAERLAEVRGVAYGDLEDTVEANAEAVFGW